MNGTLASVLRAPAVEWPEILARESRDQARPMNDDVTVTFTRAEYETLLGLLREELPSTLEWLTVLAAADAKSAWDKMEAAGRRAPLSAA